MSNTSANAYFTHSRLVACIVNVPGSVDAPVGEVPAAPEAVPGVAGLPADAPVDAEAGAVPATNLAAAAEAAMAAASAEPARTGLNVVLSHS